MLAKILITASIQEAESQANQPIICPTGKMKTPTTAAAVLLKINQGKAGSTNNVAMGDTMEKSPK